MNNKLILGENLKALAYLLQLGYKGNIDLIYIDPPFATNLDFTWTPSRANAVSPSKKGILAYSDKVLGQSFLNDLKSRLILAKELMSEMGSIYVHIDCKIGHYVKILMDEIFGFNNFRNDISRIKCNPKNFTRLGYGNEKDMILFYTKTKKAIWNEPFWKYTENDIKKLFPKIDSDGKHYTTVPLHAPGENLVPQSFKGIMPPSGRHWRTDVNTLMRWDKEGLIEWSNSGNPRKKIFADLQNGKRVQDIWSFKDPQKPLYPTQKNLDLLRLIVQTSSNRESMVLDFYCGSGTTLLAAQELGRNWIGVDSSPLAIKIANQRLQKGNSLFKQVIEIINL